MRYLYLLLLATQFVNSNHITGSSYTRKANRLSRSRQVNPEQVSIFNDLIVGERSDSFNILFQHSIPTDLTISTTSNGGSVFYQNSMANISSGTNANGYASLKSKNALHYISGHEAYAFFTALFPTSAASSTQWIGLLNDSNGLAIGYNGTTFSMLHRNNSINTITPQQNFNLDVLDGSGVSGIKLNPTKLNIFKISYGWLGAAPITFHICREDGVWYPFHKINYPNLNTAPSIRNTTLPIKAEVKKVDVDNTNLTIRTASWCAGTVGNASSSQKREYQHSVKKKFLTAFTDIPILSIRNKETAFDGPNAEKACLVFFDIAKRVFAPGFGRFMFIKNATLTGASWVEKDSTNSFVEYDTNATAYNGGEEVFFVPLIGVENYSAFLLSNGININIYPGETLSLVVQPEANILVDASILWRETIS
jgi:hypothetical protein